MLEFSKPQLLFLFLMIFCTALVSHSADKFKVSGDGRINIEDIRFEVLHYAKGWKQSGQYQLNNVKSTGTAEKELCIDGIIKTESGDIRFIENFTRSSSMSAAITYRLENDKEIPTEMACLAVRLPVNKFAGNKILFDETPTKLPEEFSSLQIPAPRPVDSISIPTKNGIVKISGENLNASLQDDRKFNNNTYSLRIVLDGGRVKKLKDASLQISIALEPYQMSTLDISKSANMGFADETAGDEKGGWTDQGASNDLRALTPGKLACGGVTFNIINPNQNNKKSCMVFAGPQRDYFIREAIIQVNSKKTLPWLYLLHSSAWTPQKGVAIGTLQATYSDNSTSNHEIISRVDVGDWWANAKLEKGSVAWTGENPSNLVSLYISSVKLKDKPLKSLKFTGSGKGVWMVVGATLSSVEVPAPKDIPLTITASKDWQPLDVNTQIIPGSIMDLSSLNDAPAGKHGRIVVRNGHFEYANKTGERVKFIGANLCFNANYLTKENADKLARQWQLMGYNTVRLHHYDRHLLKGAWESTNSYEVDPQMQDKIDYLFAAMKKAGMYVTIDLYTTRTFARGEIEGWDKPAGREIKGLVPLLPGALKAWGTLSLKLLNHVNPYTGMAWKDDPALFSICPVNEDSIFGVWSTYPDVKKLYLKKFAGWLEENKLQPEDETAKARLQAQFLIETKIKSNRELEKFLRDNGVKALITGSNFISQKSQALMRSQFDFVDNHQYWDHPSFPGKAWSLPYSFKQRSVLKSYAQLPRDMMPSRIMGKPFTVTEYNFTPPNIYRAEGGAVMGAYSALQDWDALYRFDWSGSADILTQKEIKGFSISTDPLSLLTEKQITLLFRRGDVSPAQKSYVYAVDMQEATKGGAGWGAGGFPSQFSKIGLISRIGSQVITEDTNITGKFTAVTSSSKIKQDKLAGNLFTSLDDLPGAAAKADFISDTGEISIYAKEGAIKVITEQSECMVMPADKNLQGNILKTSGNNQFCSLSISAMDGHKLSDSKRMLMLHLTNIENSGMSFADQQMHELKNWGKRPYLIHRGSVNISLKTSNPELKVWAVDLSGKRLEPVKTEYTNGELKFVTETIPENGKTRMAYEIAVE